jgi:hypothetical protein
MTNSIGVNSGGPLHESQATLYGIVGNAAVKLPDVALAQLHSRSRGGLPPRAFRRVREYVVVRVFKNVTRLPKRGSRNRQDEA